MKKCFVRIMFPVLFVFFAETACAGSIDYLVNQSIDYYRILSRNAATDAGDIVNYNPAGTVRMADGAYINFNTQYVHKEFEYEVKGSRLDGLGQRTKYTQDEPTPALPSLYGVYKNNRFSGFAAFTVPGGGGTVKFEEGLPFIQELIQGLAEDFGGYGDIRSQQFESSSMYFAGTFGGAYAVTDDFSVSLGIRYIHAEKTYKGSGVVDMYLNDGTPFLMDQTMALDVEETADGVGLIIGVDYAHDDNLNFGLRYESRTNLNWKADVKAQQLGTLTLFTDGEKSESNFPALLGVGVEYRINAKIYTTMSLNYYFVRQADAGKDKPSTDPDYRFTEDYDDDYDNGWEIGIGAGYRLRDDLEVSTGYLHTDLGGNSQSHDDFEPSLDANTIGIGTKYSPRKDLDISFAIAATFYNKGERLYSLGGKETLNKRVYAIGFGLEYKFQSLLE